MRFIYMRMQTKKTISVSWADFPNHFFTKRKRNKNKKYLQRALHRQSQIKGKTGMAIATGHTEAAPNWVLSGYITLSKQLKILVSDRFSP